jgi:hypothetical protein
MSQPDRGGKIVAANQKNGGFFLDRGFLCFARLKRGQGYSLFTAADAKITLSMVPVNRKPQHIVFR